LPKIRQFSHFFIGFSHTQENFLVCRRIFSLTGEKAPENEKLLWSVTF